MKGQSSVLPGIGTYSKYGFAFLVCDAFAKKQNKTKPYCYLGASSTVMVFHVCIFSLVLEFEFRV
jgi:hypothetical protein